MRDVKMNSDILVVEDEPAIQELIAVNLEHAGHRVQRAYNAAEADAMIRDVLPDLIVLDWMLPDLPGTALARRLRADARSKDIPIIMLTARAQEQDKIEGLESGADDYITKPFSIREFRSRVRALLRRASLTPVASADEEIAAGPLRIDRARRRVEVDGRTPELTYVEFELVQILAEQPGRVFSRSDLLEKIWGSSQYRDPRTVDVHVRHLREKLERDPGKPELILTVRGVGYRFREP